MMTDERRQELMKEQKKFLINRIEREEDLVERYQKLLEEKDKEIERLKSVHRAEVEQVKEEAYSKFLVGNEKYLTRFVKEFLIENLKVDINVAGPYLNNTVYVAGDQGLSSDTQVIRQDTYGTIV